MIMTFSACQSNSPGRISETFDIQGHRGCRGIMPENSIPGFIMALEMGVTTLEMDVVITADKQVLLSHEPYMSHRICLDSSGNEISRADEKHHNIYEMTYAEVQQYDCGSKGHKDFPEQKKMVVAKPLLSNVIKAVESFIEARELNPVHYNIETKSTDLGDEVFHPKPEEFAALLLDVVEEGGIAGRTIIQSFDPRTLNAVHNISPDIRTALLVTNQLGYRHNLSRLDFTPSIFSPNKIFLTAGMIEFMHGEGIQVIPWTVNEKKRMRELIDMGVDGIITDYPERLVDVLAEMDVK
jgi:glycerophosphoryl diester phosphodiesterase